MTDQTERPASETGTTPKTADVLIAALRALVDEWKQLSGLPTPLTYADLESASQSQRTLWEAAHDLAELLTERTPLSAEDEARAWRLRAAAASVATLRSSDE
jgi:predicted nucleic acid-binding protein